MKVGLYKIAKGGFRVSYSDSDGKRIRTKFNSYRAATIFAQRLNNESKSPVPVTESSETISELLRKYIEQNPSSTITSKNPLLKSFLDYFGNLGCADLNKTLCSHWLEGLKAKKKYSSRTMRLCKYTFTPFFENLVEQSLIEKNYLAEVYIKLGTRVRQRVFLSVPEIIQLLDGLKKLGPHTTYPVTYFLVHTGCKISEVLKIRWDQIDLDSCTVSFPRTTMTNARTINLSHKILDFLKAHPKINDLTFLNDEGEAWTVNSYYKAMSIDRSATDLGRHWDSLTFRHTFAYHFLRTGKTLQQLQVVLGHRQIAQTIKFYGDILTT